MIFKQLFIFLFFASQLLVLQARAGENQENIFYAGPLYQNNDDSYGIVIELPLSIEVPNLSSDNIKLNISDREIKAFDLKTFKNSGEKLAWLISVDVSGSMAGTPLKDMKDSLLSLFSDRSSLQIGLISFGNESKIEFGIENKDEDKLLTDAVLKLKDHGGRSETKLFQALYEAVDYFEESSKTADFPLRRRILVISDGKDEGSNVSSQTVINRAKSLGISIDTVGKGRIEPQYIESLRLLAEGTGGYFVHAAPDRLSLSDALKRIYGMLMETQTAVAYFKYEAETVLTDRVAVAIDLSASKLISPPLRVKLPIPARLDPPPMYVDDTKQAKSLWEESWMWLVAITVTLVVSVRLVFPDIVLRIGGKKKPDDQTNDGGGTIVEETSRKTYSLDGDAEKLPPISPHQPNPSAVTTKPRRETIVGGAFAPPQHSKPSAVLIGIDGVVKNQEVGVDKALFFIGAAVDNDLSIPDDQYVSSRHACIRYEDGSFYILDQKSSNGTYVNGERLGSSACLLLPGSRIKVGNSILEIHKVSV